uniref:Uncharacterized protein n=1 Tax=Peronospora matthiolae TaxID=2874970 RepID=A0AAV1UNY6_9STRA
MKTFGPQFHPKNYRWHFTLQHPAKWEEYQLTSGSDKAIFFHVTIPLVNAIVLFYVTEERPHYTYYIDKQVIELVVGEMLWDSEDVEALKFKNAMRIFSHEEPPGDCTVTFKTSMAYKLAIKHVGIGFSMKDITLAIRQLRMWSMHRSSLA